MEDPNSLGWDTRSGPAGAGSEEREVVRDGVISGRMVGRQGDREAGT